MDPRLKYDLVFGDFEGYFGVKSRIKNDYYTNQAQNSDLKLVSQIQAAHSDNTVP